MGFFGRLFGKHQPSESTAPGDPPPIQAQPQPADAAEQLPGETRLSLQVLFPSIPSPDPAALLQALRALHPSLAQAQLEAKNVDGAGQGIVSWGPHRIEMLIRRKPLPGDVAKRCIAAAHYRPEQKDAAMAHRAYIVLYHEGGDAITPWDQYAALAAAAAALTRQGGIAVANAYANTSVPATLFDQLFGASDAWAKLQAMPPAMLYLGFVKYAVPRSEKVWMRTFGGHLANIPDLAHLAGTHQEGNKVFALFNAILTHLRQTGEKLSDGQTLPLPNEPSVRFRAPTPQEYMLESAGEIWVVEPQTPASQE